MKIKSIIFSDGKLLSLRGARAHLSLIRLWGHRLIQLETIFFGFFYLRAVE
jgi:hypothetical protein